MSAVRLRASLCLAVCLLLLSTVACNSTTRLRSQGARTPSQGNEGTSDGAGVADNSAPDSAAAAAGVAGDAAGGASTATAGAGTGPGGRAAGAGPNAASSGARASASGVGQGVTEKAIKIGIELNKPISYGAFGGKGTSTDQMPGAKAVVSYINAHGGIAGRQVEPVFHSIDVTSGTFAQQAQAACTALAEDARVFVALSITDGIPDPACYASHNVPYFDQRRFLESDADLARFPDHYYLVSRLVTGERWGRAWIDSLAAQHFFDPPAKVGIFRYDGPIWQRFMNDVIRPALAAHGVAVAEEQAAPAPGSAAEISGLAAPMGNAILRFRAAGVNRVIFAETGGAAPFLFMPAAESQGFRPRYGLNSMNALYFLQANDPASQLHGSVGIGWYPSDDTNGAHRMGTPAEGLCLQIFRQVGYSDADLAEVMGYCDTLLLLKQALDAAPALTVSGVRAAMEKVGSSYAPASTFSARLAPGRHVQAASAQTLAFDDGCACFRFTGGNVPIP
jgi:ABC-type branched-subunit amino acid transport system substrate-binding protein